MKKKQLNNQAQSYRAANWAVLGFVLYCLALPFLLPVVHRLLPGVVPTCAFQSLFGKPCPLCGLTRGLAALSRGNARTACSFNILVMPVALLLVIELVYRTGALVIGHRRRIPALLIRIDLWTHVVLLGVYLCYSIVFTIYQF